MKYYLKRILALTMAVLLGMMTVSGMATPAFADELQVTPFPIELQGPKMQLWQWLKTQ